MPPLTFCNLPKLPGCGIRTAQTNVLRAPRNYFDAGFRQLMGCVRHQTAANLLPRAPRFVRYETMFSREELAGPNDKFSRHAARKPMIARYRRMPHGRLQFIVGTSLPPLTFCNLPKLPGCGIRSAQTNVLRAHGNYFDAGFRQLMGCRTTKPPRIFYCAPRDSFAMKRCFRERK